MVCNSLHHCKNWVMMVSTHACGKNCEHCHGNTIAMPHAVLITCAIAELSRWTDGEYKIGHELLARGKSVTMLFQILTLPVVLVIIPCMASVMPAKLRLRSRCSSSHSWSRTGWSGSCMKTQQKRNQ